MLIVHLAIPQQAQLKSQVSRISMYCVDVSVIHECLLLNMQYLAVLSVSYTFMEDTVTSNPTEVQVKTLNDTSVVVSGLMAGKLYTFNVTAANDIGSSSILCGPVGHTIGESVTCH